MVIPKGYHFLPSHEQLISTYLLPRCMGLPLSLNIDHLVERDLYGKTQDPWSALGDLDVSHWHTVETYDDKGVKTVKNTIYVITKLSKIGNKVTRIAGCGTWVGQTVGTEIKLNNQVIGLNKMFSFEVKNKKSIINDENKRKDRWIMHEYSLDDVYLMNNEIKNKDIVLCRIIRSYKENIQKNMKKRSLAELGLCDSNNTNKKQKNIDDQEANYVDNTNYMRKGAGDDEYFANWLVAELTKPNNMDDATPNQQPLSSTMNNIEQTGLDEGDKLLLEDIKNLLNLDILDKELANVDNNYMGEYAKLLESTPNQQLIPTMNIQQNRVQDHHVSPSPDDDAINLISNFQGGGPQNYYYPNPYGELPNLIEAQEQQIDIQKLLPNITSF